jgi:hypothetical protein
VCVCVCCTCGGYMREREREEERKRTVLIFQWCFSHDPSSSAHSGSRFASLRRLTASASVSLRVGTGERVNTRPHQMQAKKRRCRR